MIKNQAEVDEADEHEFGGDEDDESDKGDADHEGDAGGEV